MTERADSGGSAPRVVDVTVPHSARIWNYWLGGKDNFQVDRVAGDEFLAVYPQQRAKARACRHFIRRAVHYLVREAGIRQFLDIGTGLPTAENTHEVAQREAPESRIVYVDNDPLVLTHARALLTSTPEGTTSYIDADLHDPDSILAAASKSLDFDQPIAMLMIGVLGHIADYDEARAIVRRLLDGLPSGSYFVECDGDDTSAEYMAAIQQYRDSGGVPYNVRTPDQIAGFFEGLELVEPGVGPIPAWRPDPADFGVLIEVAERGGVGRRR